jgi:HSP20 family protein
MTNKSKSDVAVSVTPHMTVAESPALNQTTPLEEVERLFERLMPQSWMSPNAWNWPLWKGLNLSQQNIRVPSVDVIDRDVEILIRVEIPGVEKKDVEVSVSDHTLNIRGSLKHPQKEEKHEYIRRELLQENFSRDMGLPSGVDTTNISAHLHDGILEIHLPKDEQIKRRSVEIK